MSDKKDIDKEPTKVVSMRIPYSLYKRIQLQAAKEYNSISGIVLQGIDMYLSEKGRKTMRSYEEIVEVVTEIVKKYYMELEEKHGITFTKPEIESAVDSATANIEKSELLLSDKELEQIYIEWLSDSESIIMENKLDK